MGDFYSTMCDEGGSQFTQLPKEVAYDLIMEALQARLFDPGLLENAANASIDQTFTDDRAFWEAAIDGRFRETMSVHLPGCTVTEWVPRSPGRIFSQGCYRSPYIDRMPGAEINSYKPRRKTFEYLRPPVQTTDWDPYRQEFGPGGKSVLVYGGVGTIRLGSKQSQGRQIHFLNASYSPILHQGIPLMLNDDLYGQVVGAIAEHGGVDADVTGVLRKPPASLLRKLAFDRGIPIHTFLEVQQIELKAPCQRKLSATAAVSYVVKGVQEDGQTLAVTEGDGPKHIGWTFCTFDPAKGQPGLVRATEWLVDYIDRHSPQDRELPKIITDFDEQTDHFAELKVALPLSNVVSGNLDEQTLTDTFNTFGLQVDTLVVEEFVMGDKFEQISNATIVNRSRVDNALNISSSEPQKPLAEAAAEIQALLKQLEESNPTATESEKIAYVNIATKPALKQRVVAALKAGGDTAIDEFISENKYLKIVKAVVGGWLKPTGGA